MSISHPEDCTQLWWYAKIIFLGVLIFTYGFFSGVFWFITFWYVLWFALDSLFNLKVIRTMDLAPLVAPSNTPFIVNMAVVFDKFKAEDVEI
jgi:hypothetical protein